VRSPPPLPAPAEVAAKVGGKWLAFSFPPEYAFTAKNALSREEKPFEI